MKRVITNDAWKTCITAKSTASLTITVFSGSTKEITTSVLTLSPITLRECFALG